MELAVDQHFHTAHSIAKFYNHQLKVEVFEVSSGKILERNKRAKIFCAMRNWDERAEKGYMVNIESDFHSQIDCLVPINKRDHIAISRYFCLWRLRHKFHLERLSDAPLEGIEGEVLTKEQQEVLEKMWVGYVNARAEIPARQLTGGQIQIGVDQLMQTFQKIEWGLVEARRGHFLCADAYHELCFIPISPKLAFAGNLPDQVLAFDEVALANRQSIASSTEFYFAKNMEKCPIANKTLQRINR
ncbi:MAG: hypothetical protein OCC45_01545 [Desulfotalea sp.]